MLIIRVNRTLCRPLLRGVVQLFPAIDERVCTYDGEMSRASFACGSRVVFQRVPEYTSRKSRVSEEGNLGGLYKVDRCGFAGIKIERERSSCKYI